MSELPKGWVECELKQLISISSGKSLTQKKMIAGNIPVFGGNGITGWHNESNISKKIIVIGRVGFYCGSVYITPENAWVTDNAFITSFSEDHIDIHYLYWLLKFTDLRQNDSSSAQPVISGQKVYPIKVKLPPLNEQKRIVEKLDEVLAQVDTIKTRLDGIPAILKRFRQSVLAAAVSGKLTEEWRGSSLYDDEGFPIAWTRKGLDELGELARGKSKHRPRNDPKLFGDEYPFIQTGEVAQSNGLITGCTKWYSQFGLEQSKLFPKGTLCITIAANIADTAILDIDACFPDSVVGFTPIEEITSALFVKYLIDVNKNNLEQFAPATAQKNINLKVLKSLSLPYPCLTEQNEIVRLVEQYFAFADTIEAQVKKAQTRVDNLTQSILAKAFRGELVEQDPNDEPADKLLERIAAARKEAEALAKAAKKAQTAKKRTVKKESAQEL